MHGQLITNQRHIKTRSRNMYFKCFSHRTGALKDIVDLEDMVWRNRWWMLKNQMQNYECSSHFQSLLFTWLSQTCESLKMPCGCHRNNRDGLSPPKLQSPTNAVAWLHSALCSSKVKTANKTCSVCFTLQTYKITYKIKPYSLNSPEIQLQRWTVR